jgi:hypothetical protein
MLLLIFQISDDLCWINELLGVSHLFEDSKSCKKPLDEDILKK